jgi:photosystem I subunit VIII
MAASYLPSIFVPMIGSIFPAVAMTLFFIYVEREEA